MNDSYRCPPITMWELVKFLALFYMFLAVFTLFGCAVCTAEQTRCTGNVAEICDSRGHWRTLQDCDEVDGESPFSCQTTVDEGEEAHTCLPGDVTQ